MFPLQITKEELNALPLQQYEGKVVLVATYPQLQQAIKEIRQYDVLGFDTETKPAFRKGVWYYISLLQIAVPGKVFLLRLNHTGFVQELCDLFADPAINKVGISIQDDLKSLKKLAERDHLAFEPEYITEINDIAKELGVQHAGVRNLTAVFLGFRVSKAQQTSNWENPQLTEKQIRYAATDAWVCLEIYDRLAEWGYL